MMMVSVRWWIGESCARASCDIGTDPTVRCARCLGAKKCRAVFAGFGAEKRDAAAAAARPTVSPRLRLGSTTRRDGED